MSRKIPCEIVTWYLLPAIRRELSLILITNHGLYQKDVAILLGITDAAVSQYISKKRGNIIDFDGIGRGEFETSTNNILEGVPAEKEICRLCKFLMSNGILEKIEYKGKN